jgi:hypothetical protein
MLRKVTRAMMIALAAALMMTGCSLDEDGNDSSSSDNKAQADAGIQSMSQGTVGAVGAVFAPLGKDAKEDKTNEPIKTPEGMDGITVSGDYSLDFDTMTFSFPSISAEFKDYKDAQGNTLNGKLTINNGKFVLGDSGMTMTFIMNGPLSISSSEGDCDIKLGGVLFSVAAAPEGKSGTIVVKGEYALNDVSYTIDINMTL